MRVRSALLRSVAAVTLLSLVTLVEGVACNDKKRGAIMLSLDTDMRAPKDVNAVSLTILADDVIKFNNIARVDPDGEVRFPATIAIVEPDNPNATIRIRIIALSETTPRVMRDVRTTVPRDGFIASLAIPLTFVNDGSATGTLPAGLLPAKGTSLATRTITLSDPVTLGPRDFNPYDGSILSRCGPDDRETVIEGECADSTVDSSKLPAFDPSLIGENVSGRCFDVATCFGSADRQDVDPGLEVVDVDLAACRFRRDTRPNLNLNLGLATAASAQGSGECLGEKCIVPLDQGGGWTDDGTYIVLSKGVCRKLASQAAILVKNASANPACTTKVPGKPVCQAGASSTDGGIAGDAADAALVAEGKPVQVVKASLDSAIEVTALGLYHAGPAGLLFQPTSGSSRSLVPPTPSGEPWVSGQYSSTLAFGWTRPVVGTVGQTVGYVIAEGSDAGATQPITSMNPGSHVTAVTVTSNEGVLWALSSADLTSGGLYTSGFFDAGSAPLLPSSLAISAPFTALGHLAKNVPAQLLVGDQSGKVQLCDLGTRQCAPAVAAGSLPIDSIGVDALATSISAYLLTPNNVQYVQKSGAGIAAKVVIDEPGNLGGTVVPPVSYLPRSVTIAGRCGFYSSPKGIEYVSIDGTINGWLVDLKGTSGPAVSLRTYGSDIYYALYAVEDPTPNVGGGVFRVPVPARCLP